MIVAQVGGSLYDWPELGPALRAWLARQPEPVLLFPGGGDAADAVRNWDRVHALGEEHAHWLAIRSLSLGAHFLQRLLGSLPVVESPLPGILDPYPYFRTQSGPPHTWTVTTDSLAAWVAIQSGASKLVLLKSTDIPVSLGWKEASDAGFVDGYFPELLVTANLRVEAVNLRSSLEFNLQVVPRG